MKSEFPTLLSADTGDCIMRNDNCVERAGYSGFFPYSQVFPVVFL